jgi:tetratricopeptide (TPR) repeat protein
VLFHLSRTLRDLGEFDHATDTLVACQELDAQTDPPAIQREHLLACQGELELRRGSLDRALECFEAARALDPESSYLWERVGRVLELQGNIDVAAEAYGHAARLPRGAFALFALGRFHTNVTNDLPAGGRALVEALSRLRSAEPLVRLELARLQLACSRPNAALVQIERALACRREGGFAEGLRLAADLSARLGRPSDAVRYLRQLAQLVPDPNPLLERADSLERGDGLPPGPTPTDAPLPPDLQFLNGTEVSTPGRERVNGVVDRFMAEKGFGFLRYGENQSLFFHVTQCEDDAREMAPGTRVSFVVGHNPKKGKPQAESVRRDH